MRYAVVIEKADGNYSAYVPDLPGCVATGETVDAVEAEIREAIRFHIDGLKADGLPVPAPTSIADYVEAWRASLFDIVDRKIARGGTAHGFVMAGLVPAIHVFP
jgi:predicted RNase H-like HicB family nuclease